VWQDTVDAPTTAAVRLNTRIDNDTLTDPAIGVYIIAVG
jgi:hypothetical protein